MMADFEKRSGAPAGTWSLTVAGGSFTFSDGGTVTTTNPEAISNLRVHPWVQETGQSQQAPASARVQSLVSAIADDNVQVGDVLTRTADGYEWLPSAGGITQKSTAIAGAGTATTSGTPSTSTQLVAADSARIELTIYNNHTSAEVWFARGTAAVVGRGDVARPGGPPVIITSFTGAVNMISTTASVPVSYVAV